MKPVRAIICFVCLILSCSGNKTDTSQAAQQDSASLEATETTENSSSTADGTPVDTTGFGEVINLFRTPDAEMTELALKFVGEPNYGGRENHTVALLETDPVYLVLYVKMDLGTGVETLNAASFGKDGTINSNEELAESIPAGEPYGEGKSYKYIYEGDRKTFFVTRTTRKWDESKQTVLMIESVTPFYLDENGNVEDGRSYREVSEEALDVATLRDVPKDELKIMRNEVFAVYGYIFKTEPLKSHFEAKPWYKGERENVDDMLTDIEKANVALIKEVEISK